MSDKPPWGPYQLRPNPAAILRLSLGTAAAISTALLIPDVFALIPSAPDAVTLICRCIGLWGYAYVLWSAGFLCILHLSRIFGGKIILDSEGIKPGRLAKKVSWDSIMAVTIAERKLFSRVFFVPAYQMTLHMLKPDGKRTAKAIASFQYSEQEFFSLFYYISKFSCGAQPSCIDAFIFKDANCSELKKIAEEGKLKRVFLTLVISFGLITFLARKAIVNYTFNMGNKEFRAARYDRAIGYYTTASAVEFSFAPAWDRLARCELREGDLASAEAHWKEALKWKPDYVESKLGLSTIYMLEGRLDEADKLIATASRLAPLDETAYLNRAQLDVLMGKGPAAIARLEKFIGAKPRNRGAAICMLARCYVRQGNLDKAEHLLASEQNMLTDPYLRAFCITATAELKLAQADYIEASKLLQSVKRDMHSQPELLIDFARVAISQNNIVQANRYLDEAEKINPDSPWIALARADLATRDKSQKASSDSYIAKALAYKYEDPFLLAACAEVLQRNGQKEKSRELAQKSLKIDPANNLARKTLDQSGGVQ